MPLKSIDLMIVGAQKGGTSSLSYYLGQHPLICTHQQPELMYFSVDEIYAKGYQQAFERYFAWCYSPGKSIVGKNVAILYSKEVMKRLHTHNPQVQIVVSLREPVERAYSAYWFARRLGWENLSSFEEAIKPDLSRFGDDEIRRRNCMYLDRSLYVKHLRQLFQVFNRDQVHVFLMDDIKNSPSEICTTLYNLLGLEFDFVPDTSQRKNVSAAPRNKLVFWVFSSKHPIPRLSRRTVRRILPDRAGDVLKNLIRRENEKEYSPPPLNSETREKLATYFKPYNDELSDLIDRDLSVWSLKEPMSLEVHPTTVLNRE